MSYIPNNFDYRNSTNNQQTGTNFSNKNLSIQPKKEKLKFTNIGPFSLESQFSSSNRIHFNLQKIMPTPPLIHSIQNDAICQKMTLHPGSSQLPPSINVQPLVQNNEIQSNALDVQNKLKLKKQITLTESSVQERKILNNSSKSILDTLKYQENKLDSLQTQIKNIENFFINFLNPLENNKIQFPTTISNENPNQKCVVANQDKILKQNEGQHNCLVQEIEKVSTNKELQHKKIDLINNKNNFQTSKRERPPNVQIDQPQKKLKITLPDDENCLDLIVDDDANQNFLKILRTNIFTETDKPFTYFSSNHNLFYYPNLILSELKDNSLSLNVDPFRIHLINVGHLSATSENTQIYLLNTKKELAAKFLAKDLSFLKNKDFLTIYVAESQIDISPGFKSLLKTKNKIILLSRVIYLRVVIDNYKHDIPVLNLSPQFFKKSDNDTLIDKNKISELFEYLTNLEDHVIVYDEQQLPNNTAGSSQENIKSVNNPINSNNNYNQSFSNNLSVNNLNGQEFYQKQLEFENSYEYLQMPSEINEKDFNDFIEMLDKKQI